jgi:hypothetical protein
MCIPARIIGVVLAVQSLFGYNLKIIIISIIYYYYYFKIVG